jgi:hypothetical protein
VQIKFKAGEFEVETWTESRPMWTEIRYGQQKMHGIHHSELRDLCYVLERLRAQIRGALPDKDKHQMD